MKFIVFGIILAILVSSGGSVKVFYDLKDAPQLYQKFLTDFNITYNTPYELLIHYEAFKQALKDINLLNSQTTVSEFEITRFADYTPDQLHKMGLIQSPVYLAGTSS